MSKQTGRRPRFSSSSSEERGDGSQPQVKRRHQALFSYVLDTINRKFEEEIPPVVEDAIGKVNAILGTTVETQSQELRRLESITKDHAEQMAQMRAQHSDLKCQSDQQLAEIREIKNLINGLMGQQNKARENPAMVTEKQNAILGTTVETQSQELRRLESIIKDPADQMAQMQAQHSDLKCQSDQPLAEIQELKNLINDLMGQQNKALENPAMVTEKQIEELRRMNPEHAMPLERTPSRPLERGDSRRLELHFRTRLSSPVYTEKQIKGVGDATILIGLIDANTGNVVESGPEASIKLDVVVLEGDFNKENNNDWTRRDFERHQMRQREGKVSLLAGDLQVTLKGGVGELGKLKFTDNSSWHKSKMFRIGLKVAPGCCEGVRIREAITEALRVKEHRGETYKKQYPAKPDDEVWRLKNIAKDGAFHMKLREKGVVVVEDFLREYVRDGKSLRNVLGGGMTETKWNVLIEHAKSCVQSGKLYQYSYGEAMNQTVVFDIIGQLKGYTADGCLYSADSLSHGQKECLDQMVRKAYNDWDRVAEFQILSNFVNNPVSDISPTAASVNNPVSDISPTAASVNNPVSEPRANKTILINLATV